MDLLEQLNALGLEYREHSSRDNEIYICCPFCEEEGETPDFRFRLSINVAEGKINCFNCGKKSSNAEYTWTELQRVLQSGKLEAVSKPQKKKKKKKVELPPDFSPLKLHGGEHWNKVALRYLATRNITGKQIVNKNLGYSTVGDFRYRIIIPVYYRGKLKGIVGRTFVVGIEPKYKNSIGEKVIYNLPDSPKDTVVLTEGAFDALTLEKTLHKIMDSGAVLGHSLTEKQVEQLEGYKKIILWPDPDILTNKAVLKGWMGMARQLEDADKQVYIVLPESNHEEYDPSDLYPDEIRKKLYHKVEFNPSIELRLKAEMAFRED